MASLSTDNLKSIIKIILMNEAISMGKDYAHKEAIMQHVQEKLAEEDFSTQGEYVARVKQEIANVREDVDQTLHMVEQTLEAVPFEVFKKAFTKTDL